MHVSIYIYIHIFLKGLFDGLFMTSRTSRRPIWHLFFLGCQRTFAGFGAAGFRLTGVRAWVGGVCHGAYAVFRS